MKAGSLLFCPMETVFSYYRCMECNNLRDTFILIRWPIDKSATIENHQQTMDPLSLKCESVALVATYGRETGIISFHIWKPSNSEFCYWFTESMPYSLRTKDEAYKMCSLFNATLPVPKSEDDERSLFSIPHDRSAGIWIKTQTEFGYVNFTSTPKIKNYVAILRMYDPWVGYTVCWYSFTIKDTTKGRLVY